MPAPIENMILRYVKSKEPSELLGVEWPGGSAVEESEDDWKWKRVWKKGYPKIPGLTWINGVAPA